MEDFRLLRSIIRPTARLAYEFGISMVGSESDRILGHSDNLPCISWFETAEGMAHDANKMHIFCYILRDTRTDLLERTSFHTNSLVVMWLSTHAKSLLSLRGEGGIFRRTIPHEGFVFFAPF